MVIKNKIYHERRKGMDTQKNIEKLLKVEDVAGILAVKPITIYSWSEAGKLRSLKVGRRLLRFREADVRDFIENAGNKIDK